MILPYFQLWCLSGSGRKKFRTPYSKVILQLAQVACLINWLVFVIQVWCVQIIVVMTKSTRIRGMNVERTVE